MFCEPLACWRHTSVRDHRTSSDWAEEIKHLVDSRTDAEKIILVMDNLNTHTWASLYKRFEPREAKRIKDKLEIHYTPKHGSWLDMAEIELNVMTRQCLKRRISDIDVLRSEISAWETDRNNADSKIKWQFTTDDARNNGNLLLMMLETNSFRCIQEYRYFKYESLRRYTSELT